MKLRLTIAVTAALLLAVAEARAYSVLTHQAIIDASWEKGIVPALKARFAGLSDEDLSAARAYAYGGCIIQDMGYYPFGNKLFTDLTHYVRSGDFVEALLNEARDANEYAFALGALAHYASDNDGHQLGINRAEPMIYPKVRAKFGLSVPYEKEPVAHLKTEFGFDVLQVARSLYAPQAFHDFIGFEVARDLLERAFLDTYGIELKDVFFSEALAVGSYRRAVSLLLPEMTKVAWEARKDDITKARPGMTRERFVFTLTQADYVRQWGDEYRRPGFFARLLSVLMKIVPKIGPFRPFQFRMPSADADAVFMRSFTTTLDSYRKLLSDVRGRRLALENLNFDTGSRTEPGEYELADRTYSRLLERLAKDDFRNVSPSLKRNVLAFYANADAPNSMKSHRGAWRRTLRDLARLRGSALSAK